MAEVAQKTEEIGAGDAKPVDAKPELEKEVTAKSDEAPKIDDASPESTPEKSSNSKLESDIIRQVEYYFGDANLRRDKFLLEQIGKDEDGWVPFSVLLTFKRLAALSTDIEVIANALMKSEEGLVEISEDKTKIRRHPEKPIPEHNEERRKEIASRTAYVKGFPLETEMSDLIEFFNPFEKVANIIMRKYSDKATKTYKFKGSVFVTFVKKEQCEAFVNKEKVQYKDRDLIRLWQEKYFEQKKTEERGSKKKNKKVKEEDKIELPKGAILHFEGCDENTSREFIRESLAKFVAEVETEIAFVEYKKGEKSGYVRLTIENTAKPLLDKLEDKKVKLEDGVELEFRTLSGEEETEFLKKAVEQMKQRRNNQNKNRGNRKRRDVDKDDDEPPSKQKH